jgi:hypothetical protein
MNLSVYAGDSAALIDGSGIVHRTVVAQFREANDGSDCVALQRDGSDCVALQRLENRSGFVYSMPEILRALDREARLEEARSRFLTAA